MPAMDTASRRVNELFELTMREHRPGGPLADAGDLVNDVLALHDTDPQFLPETDLLMAAMGPFIAGLDTAAITTSFTLYEAIKRPQLAERLRTEADALFAGGKTPTADALGRLDAMHRLTLEVLRFYPSVPIILRTSSNSFEAAGYRIPAGARVVCAAGLTHHLEEHFPEPAKFDIDRYLPERAEHRQADAYAPFGRPPSLPRSRLRRNADHAHHRVPDALRRVRAAPESIRNADDVAADAAPEEELQVAQGARADPRLNGGVTVPLRVPAPRSPHIAASAATGRPSPDPQVPPSRPDAGR